jgi:hypothetical protein
MKRKIRKFAEGGDFETGTPDIEAPSEKVSSDDLSFKDAFSMARKSGDKTFMWRGTKYTTKIDDGSKPQEKVTKTETKVQTATPMGRRAAKGKLPQGYSPRVGSGKYDDPTSSFGERVMSPLRRLTSGDLFGQRNVERVSRGAGVDTEEARRRLRDAGMKKGGTVGSSASRRADGIAQRGKTRGRMY